MTTLLLVAATLAALAAHEFARGSRQAWMRALSRLFLLAVVGMSMLLALRLEDRVTTWWHPPTPNAQFDGSGDPMRLKALAAQQPSNPFPGTGAAVDAWRVETLSRLRREAGFELTASDRTPATSTEETVSIDGIRRTLIRYTSWDGTKIPAYVFEPARGAMPKGAVLVIPGHGVGAAATAGIVADYQHGAALALAQRGFITLTPELRGFGLLSPRGASTHRLVAAAALAAGSSYKAVVARDLDLALTVLEHWRGVDPKRLAVTGTSLGGELAVLLAALDSRIRVAVSNSYGGAVGPAVESDDLDDESDQTPHGCHTVPGINQIVLQEDWVRLIAPRPVLVVRGSRNTARTAPEFSRRVSAAYQAVGAPERFDLKIAPGAHEFYVEPTAAFLAKWL